MLKKLTATAITIGGFLSLATPAFAAGGLCPTGSSSGYNFNILCSLNLSGSLFGNLITIIFVIATLLALVYLIWGGIKWVTSGGDKTKVDGARAAIVASIIGLIVVFLSYFILNVVVGLFIPGFSLQTVTLPTINGGGSSSSSSCSSHIDDEAGCRAANCSWAPNTSTITIYDGSCN